MLTNSWTKQLNQLLLKNLHKTELTNASIARQMYMSERAFYNKVKKITGLTPNHYIRAYRLRVAKQLLESGRVRQVKQVAQQVGFTKASYFSQLFEKAYGERPVSFL